VTSNSRLVFSTEGNNLCPACGKTLHKCRCSDSSTQRESADGILRIRKENKGRGGKQVTVISGYPGNADEARKLLKRIKARCGTGGTLKDQTMEIQGDRVDQVIEILTDLGYQVKRSGG